MPVTPAAGDALRRRNWKSGFAWGAAIGTLGGLVGLGGAEFRLPVLLQAFSLAPLAAVLVNLRISLVTVCAALAFRTAAQGTSGLLTHLPVALPVLGGALVGAWLGAALAHSVDARWLRRAIALLLLLLAGVMFFHDAARMIGHFALPAVAAALAGFAAGVAIGIVCSLIGVAGGELIIPTLMLCYGLDVKTAGTVSLAISLPTMLMGLARHRAHGAALMQAAPTGLVSGMSAGSVLGAAAGAALLGWIAPPAIHGLLGAILLISAIKLWMAGARARTASAAPAAPK